MATKWPEELFVGDEGVIFVEYICNKARQIFVRRPYSDYAFDGQIEFLNADREPTGAVCYIQCKSGMSYISNAGEYVLKADKRHFETWGRQTIPVIGIVHNPQSGDARWVDITEWIRTHPESANSGPYAIHCPASQAFDVDGVRILQDHVERVCRALRALNPFDTFEDYFKGGRESKDEWLTRLFAQHRWSPLTCMIVHQLFILEDDPEALRYLAYLMSFYRSHPDRFYTTENAMPPSSRPLLDRVASECVKRYKGSEVRKLLACIDESGLERGSMGQTVALILEEIPSADAILERIIDNDANDPLLRGHAIATLVQYLGYKETELFHRVLDRGQSDQFLLEALYWAIELLSQE